MGVFCLLEKLFGWLARALDVYSVLKGSCAAQLALLKFLLSFFPVSPSQSLELLFLDLDLLEHNLLKLFLSQESLKVDYRPRRTLTFSKWLLGGFYLLGTKMLLLLAPDFSYFVLQFFYVRVCLTAVLLEPLFACFGVEMLLLKVRLWSDTQICHHQAKF